MSTFQWFLKISGTDDNKVIAIPKRSLNEDSIRKFKHKLQNTNWQNVLNQQNTSNAYNFFLIKFCLYNKTYPSTEHKIKQKFLLSPWIMEETALSWIMEETALSWITEETALSSKKKQGLYVKNPKTEQLQKTL